MQQPQSSKLKVRAHSQAPAPATLRERFEAEARLNASRSKRRRKGYSDSHRTSAATAIATPNGFYTLLKGLFIIGALAAALYFAAAIPNRFSYLEPFKAKIDQVIASITQSEIAAPAATNDAIKPNEIEPQTIAETSEPTVKTAEPIAATTEAIDIKLEPITEPSEAIAETSETVQEPTTVALTEVEVSASQKPAISLPTANPIAGVSDGVAYRVQTYRARMFSDPSSATATETAIEHNAEITVLGREGDWVKVQVKNSGLIGFIHITQITG